VSRVRRRLPKRALEPLMDCCRYLAGRWRPGERPAEVFGRLLEEMKEHEGFFFGRPWNEEKGLGLGEEERAFIEGGGNQEERGWRFTLVCVRRNMSMEGLDEEGFTRDYEVIGRESCRHCAVREAVRLRKRAEEYARVLREVEELMRQPGPSDVTRDWHMHLTRPETVRREKMTLVELRLYEELGGAEGKSCEDENRYNCPHGMESDRLIEEGALVEALWRHVWWYDMHWNRSSTHTPPRDELRWYHYDEPGILDVTSYEDLLEALDDGRMTKILEEHRKYMEETGREAWAL
jgi:hypothetical protein